MSMRIRFVVPLFVFVSISCPGQSLAWHLGFGAGGTRPMQPEVVPTSENDNGLWFGGVQGELSVQVMRRVGSRFAASLRASYSFGKSHFELPCNCAHPQDRVIRLLNDVRMNSLDIVAAIQYRTRNEHYWYGKAGLGISYLAKSTRDVEYAVDFIGPQPDSIGTIASSEVFTLKTHQGRSRVPMIDISIGHEFGLWNSLLLETFVLHDLEYRVYSIGYFQGLSQSVDIRRTVIGLRCYVFLAS